MPVANRIGEEGEGFKITMTGFDHGRYTVASGATGIIRASLEASVELRQDPQNLWQTHRRTSTHPGKDRQNVAGL